MFKHLVVFFVLALQGLLALGFTNPIKQTDGSDPFMVSLTSTLIRYTLISMFTGLSRGVLL